MLKAALIKCKQPFLLLSMQCIIVGCLLSLLTGCVTNKTQINHYRQSTGQYCSEVVTHTTHDQWTVQQQTPVNAAIQIAPGNTQVGVSIDAPKQPTYQSHVIYPNPIYGDCYTMKPAIINGQHTTIVEPCQ